MVGVSLVFLVSICLVNISCDSSRFVEDESIVVLFGQHCSYLLTRGYLPDTGSTQKVAFRDKLRFYALRLHSFITWNSKRTFFSLYHHADEMTEGRFRIISRGWIDDLRDVSRVEPKGSPSKRMLVSSFLSY